MEIPKAQEFEYRVFAIKNEKEFDSIALDLYHFQFANNQVYNSYCKAVNRTPDRVTAVADIPFLPVSFFKSHKIVTTDFTPELEFRSSGTTGQVTSAHYVRYASLYEQSFINCFKQFFGPVEDFCIIGLLPSYLERGHSSLVYMVDHMIRKSGKKESGFYLYELKQLSNVLKHLEQQGQKTLLIGVTYALLDFSEQYPMQLQHTLVMETGGMKGRKKEMIREELYEQLRTGFGVSDIYSEYGMTELLSQAYSKNGMFRAPAWMKILLRDETDPFSNNLQDPQLTSGAINVIDLANIYSCSFIATEDSGRIHADKSFEVLGRMDHSDIRGCSLMVVG